MSRSDAERAIKEAVEQARTRGYSWAFIGKIIGTSGEAARQRYGASRTPDVIGTGHPGSASNDELRGARRRAR